MRRLVFITQEYDPDATILGVTRDWVAALARRCAGVDVVAAGAPPGAASGGPPNVRLFTLGKERGAGRVAQAATLARTLARTVPGAGAVFVHMVPRFAVLSAPFAAVTRRRLALWYAQGGVDRSLRLASRLVDDLLTPTRDSFPLGGPAVSRRLRITGHGIDTGRYAPDGTPPAAPPQLLAVGRLSPSKRYDRLLDAAALLPKGEWRLRIAGPPLYASDRDNAAALRRRADALGIADRVDFSGAVPYALMPAAYRAAWALAHTSGTGSLDKVVLEAMACGTPVLSTAPSSRTAFGTLAETMWCPTDTAPAFAAALAGMLDWSPRRRREVGLAAREVVQREHSLEGWAERVTAILGVG
jgi:glycosyltransferase involved in cell wall biosynthesis